MHNLPFDTGQARSPFGWDSFLTKACVYFFIPCSVMFYTSERYYSHVLGTRVLISYRDLVTFFDSAGFSGFRVYLNWLCENLCY